MKIRLSVSDDSYEDVKRFLTGHGIEIDEDDDAEFVLLQKNRYPGHLPVKTDNGSKKMISVDDIITIESYGHTIEIHTQEETFTTSDRLYQLINSLDPKKFLRISNSVIVAVPKIRDITPTLSMKFILKMSNGSKVDVTRSYYGKFKEFLGI